MGEDVDGAVAAARFMNEFGAEAADGLAGGDVFFSDLGGLRIGEGARADAGAASSSARSRSSAQRRLTAVGRVASSSGMGAVDGGVARIAPGGERHAIGAGHADQRRAAHRHRADRCSGVFAGRERSRLEAMRQRGLIDDMDPPPVGVEPDRSVVATVNSHAVRFLLASKRRAWMRSPFAPC